MHTTHDLHAVATDAHADQRAGAVKRGRNPRWPYVPVITYLNADGTPHRTEQVRGKAFATGEEATAHARRTINTRIDSLAARLALPNHRALREHYGLPRDLGA